ncbi:MAG TPA: hypothetical protein ENJ01_09060 [Gammaproteobacteria bacterium]|nr:hypothetical protein [Gammaproteobacteria bacterium]
MKRFSHLAMPLLLALFTTTAQAVEEEVISLEGTTVVGNRELPKVLYIVPWQESELPDMTDLPLNTLINDALSPIERDVFQRQIQFHYQLSR